MLLTESVAMLVVQTDFLKQLKWLLFGFASGAAILLNTCPNGTTCRFAEGFPISGIPVCLVYKSEVARKLRSLSKSREACATEVPPPIEAEVPKEARPKPRAKGIIHRFRLRVLLLKDGRQAGSG